MITFLKLGGSLITDKSKPETPRLDILDRLAAEIKSALDRRSDLKLLIGHGSGSYGHVAAHQYSTHLGVLSPEGWRGFAKVAHIAGKLNYLVADALDRAEVPIFRIQPSASAVCEGRVIREMATTPIEYALNHGLVPLIYGDVAIDTTQGGAIMSTEDVFAFLSKILRPSRMLLVGDYPGVRDNDDQIIPEITPTNYDEIRAALGKSAHTDVTGGMAAKVESMLELCQTIPGLTVTIFSGDEPKMLEQALVSDDYAAGTRIAEQ